MTKETLLAKLEELKQKSESLINQVNEHDKIAQTLREEALIVKGRYHAVEELIAEFVEDFKVEVKVNKKGNK
jgi:hypothetical protein